MGQALSLEKLTNSLRHHLLGAKYYEASQALELVLEVFEGKVRKDGTPVVGHFISVAQFTRTLTANLKNPDLAITVALLHDVVEDSSMTYSDLSAMGFSSDTVANVALLTKNTVEDKSVNKTLSAYFDAIVDSPTASIVKGADRIHNFDTMIDVFSVPKQREYVAECSTYILPMLKRARRKFPQQEPAYENIKSVLLTQIKMIEHSLRSANDTQS